MANKFIGAAMALALLFSGTAEAKVRVDKITTSTGVKLERTTDDFTNQTSYRAELHNWFGGDVSFDERSLYVRVLGHPGNDRTRVQIYFQITNKRDMLTLDQLQFRGGESLPFKFNVPDARCTWNCMFSATSIIEVPEDVLRAHAVDGKVEMQIKMLQQNIVIHGFVDLREVDALDAASA